MKVQTQQSTFQPISIVIENKEELQFFTALLGAVTGNHMKAFGVEVNSKVYDTLMEACNDEIGAASFTVMLDEQVPAVEGTEVDWSKVPAGTVILVRDDEMKDWTERRFMYIGANGMYVCEHSERGKFAPIPWKKAKLIL